MPESIKHDAYYPHPPERVWRAIADGAALAQWLMPNDFQPQVGHRFTFRREPMPAINFDGIIHCEVVACDPPHRLTYTWTGGGLNTVVSFRLEPEGEGTRLYLEHSGFDLSDATNRFAYDGMGPGWRSGLDTSLRKVIDALAAPR
ncbi:MAG TPA: SRPBCC domain-containing protein [Dehalococcoidia bacterium]